MLCRIEYKKNILIVINIIIYRNLSTLIRLNPKDATFDSKIN